MIERFSDFFEADIECIPFSLGEEEDKTPQDSVPEELPLLALRNTALLPSMIVPVTLRREQSLKLVKKSYEDKTYLGVVAQKDKTKETDPLPEDIFTIGTIARVVQIFTPANGSEIVALIQGVWRFEILEIVRTKPYLVARIGDRPITIHMDRNEENNKAIIASIKDLASQVFEKTPHISNNIINVVNNVENPNFLINFVLSMLDLDAIEKQEILELDVVQTKAERLLKILTKEHQKVELKQQIQGKVRSEIDKQYREQVLNEQLKTIQKELGGSQVDNDIKDLKDKAKSKKWSSAVAEIFDNDIKKLQRINSMSPDYSVQLNYLETVVDLPWGEYSDDNFDLKHAQDVLDADHFGLEKVKKRILEYIAVLKLRKDLKAPILCLLGPPGVGKTSLGKSLAAALGRQYVRMSLGGLHDEAELRGHRRTYIGAMPGRIITNIKKAQTANPVFVLDEIDKVSGLNIQGDPSAALLEILDPEQNMSFHDNYLDIDFDLSRVLFVATANSATSIHPALLDRMEVIDISGYFLEEKIEIAKRHLLPKQLKEHGVEDNQLHVSDEVIHDIIKGYTRESGVRQLDKQIAKITRYRARQIVEKNKYQKDLQSKNLNAIFGIPTFDETKQLKEDTVGVVTGLAWTVVGGEILFVEASSGVGKGQLTMTGNLGDVMKESATLAYEYLKSDYKRYNITEDVFEKRNVHIHVPEGATPKDGPSAGITLFTALYSVFTKKKVKSNLAMTGEITLRGKVLPVGGIKEKILAAKRADIKHVILCKANKKHVEEIELKYIDGLTFHYIENVREIINLAF
ncbi:Lon protease [Bacteroidia bacterium]|nr:Lon protease [Bacteroidia bacterium]